MKKNKMMRIASAVLVLTILTTCLIGGTFAKYVTEANGSDTARVAKWGVEVSTSGSLFGAKYVKKVNTVSTSDEDTISVKSEDGQTKVIAPGTQNSGEGLKFTLSGTPETSVEVKISLDGDDVFLKAGEYPDMTTEKAADKFNFTTDYHPIVYTLKNGNGDTLVSGAMSVINKYLDDNVNSEYAAGTNLETLSSSAVSAADDETVASPDGTYKLSWSWGFESGTTEEDKIPQDQKDTVLGNLAANKGTNYSELTKLGLVAGTNYSLNANVSLSIKVTQVD